MPVPLFATSAMCQFDDIIKCIWYRCANQPLKILPISSGTLEYKTIQQLHVHCFCSFPSAFTTSCQESPLLGCLCITSRSQKKFSYHIDGSRAVSNKISARSFWKHQIIVTFIGLHQTQIILYCFIIVSLLLLLIVNHHKFKAAHAAMSPTNQT